MEGCYYPKPPWEGVERNWQRRSTGISTGAHPLFTELQYGSWSETPSIELLKAKEGIAQFERDRRWDLLKKMVNPYEIVFTQEDEHFHPSISLKKPLSRSYFKMAEMLEVLDLFPRHSKSNPNVRTAHVAEGPGGFIQATIDLAERYGKRIKQATAMTLRPTDSYIPGWRRAANFLHVHKEVKLHYGYDDTGNIYVKENQDSFVDTTSPGAHLFTADGGFDFSADYAMQEQSVFRLLACSAFTGLKCLVSDGAMVIKIFDTFSESTSILLTYMGRCFKEWQLYKPAMSRPCNSERYFLGRGFLGLNPKMRAVFEDICAAAAGEKYPQGLASVATAEEIAYLQVQQGVSVQGQLEAIKRSIVFAADITRWYSSQLPADFQTSLLWCNRFKIPTSLKSPIHCSPPKSPIWIQKRDENTCLLDAGQQ